MTTFTDFLRDKHAEDYMGNGDDMGEACDEWISSLDPQELIDYGEEWGGDMPNPYAFGTVQNDGQDFTEEDTDNVYLLFKKDQFNKLKKLILKND